jgi:hypothetical protein
MSKIQEIIVELELSPDASSHPHLKKRHTGPWLSLRQNFLLQKDQHFFPNDKF